MTLVDDLYRDADRLLRSGARPLELLFSRAAWLVADYRIARALQRLPRWLRRPLGALHVPIERALQSSCRSELPAGANVGGGLRLLGDEISVARGARIGRDCELGEGSTLLADERG